MLEYNSFKECVHVSADTSTIVPDALKPVDDFNKNRFIDFDLILDATTYSGSNKKILGETSNESSDTDGLILDTTTGELRVNFPGIQYVIFDNYTTVNTTTNIILINIHDYGRITINGQMVYSGFQKFNFSESWSWGSSDTNLIANYVQCTNITMGR